MRAFVSLVSLLVLTACTTTSVTSSEAQQTTEPIVIELPVTETSSARVIRPHDPHEVRHEADVKAQPWQRIERANKAAKVEPGLENYVNAVQIYPYTPGALYQLYTAPGQVSVISLERGESLVSVSAGDTARWIVGDTVSGAGASTQVQILVKPVSPGLSTNLVITTSKRTYLVEMRSFRETYMAALSWAYPADPHMVVEEGSMRNVRTLDPADLNFHYEISGPRPRWRPARVFDDAMKTYIEFPSTVDTSETPPLFIIGSSKEPELVNYRVLGRYYVVDRLFDHAELRLGTEDQVIVAIKRVEGAHE
ncbi:P-type conjugative transfer protein TrbG [Parvularcula sp. IMCC14364]|uniref:P-type conjugative transfer protein TrbG n=1 Tax=Parvularcula sp. IMCC14364 TaxID=3067902 RepID=UPI0027421E1F|nr:P-type conjugative transfer protein TrbG [Parvularcula sp. IMCC14364]